MSRLVWGVRCWIVLELSWVHTSSSTLPFPTGNPHIVDKMVRGNYSTKPRNYSISRCRCACGVRVCVRFLVTCDPLCVASEVLARLDSPVLLLVSLVVRALLVCVCVCFARMLPYLRRVYRGHAPCVVWVCVCTLLVSV
jgi:hypothetical protein